jgi:hypothetical protein
MWALMKPNSYFDSEYFMLLQGFMKRYVVAQPGAKWWQLI